MIWEYLIWAIACTHVSDLVLKLVESVKLLIIETVYLSYCRSIVVTKLWHYSLIRNLCYALCTCSCTRSCFVFIPVHVLCSFLFMFCEHPRSCFASSLPTDGRKGPHQLVPHQLRRTDRSLLQQVLCHPSSRQSPVQSQGSYNLIVMAKSCNLSHRVKANKVNVYWFNLKLMAKVSTPPKPIKADKDHV